MSAPEPPGLDAALDVARRDCGLVGNGYLQLTRHADGRITVDRIDPATVILTTTMPGTSLPPNVHPLRRGQDTPTVSDGFYVCECGAAHPHGYPCPSAILAARRAFPERDDPAAERAHRDDLARDAARRWVYERDQPDSFVPDRLASALDRLAAAYLPDGLQDPPR